MVQNDFLWPGSLKYMYQFEGALLYTRDELSVQSFLVISEKIKLASQKWHLVETIFCLLVHLKNSIKHSSHLKKKCFSKSSRCLDSLCPCFLQKYTKALVVSILHLALFHQVVSAKEYCSEILFGGSCRPFSELKLWEWDRSDWMTRVMTNMADFLFSSLPHVLISMLICMQTTISIHLVSIPIWCLIVKLNSLTQRSNLT